MALYSARTAVHLQCKADDVSALISTSEKPKNPETEQKRPGRDQKGVASGPDSQFA
jgi:hypothetical protein